MSVIRTSEVPHFENGLETASIVAAESAGSIDINGLIISTGGAIPEAAVTSHTDAVLDDGLTAIPVPSNYTATGTSVWEYIQGIDDALGLLTPHVHATYTLDEAGTADARSKRMRWGGSISGVDFSLQASDTGTVTVRVINDAGTTTSEGTATITSDDCAEDTSVTWTTGTGTFVKGDRIEMEATSGFSTATWATMAAYGPRTS